MTAPVVHGFADWQRQSPVTTVIFLNVTETAQTDKTYGQFFVGLSKAILVGMVGNTQAVLVNVRFSQDQGNTQPVDNTQFLLPANGSLNCAIPILGPWMQVEVTSLGGAANWAIRLSDAARPGPLTASYRDALLIDAPNTAVGAATNIRLRTSLVWPGQALWIVNTVATGWSAELFYTDQFGTDTDIDHVTQSVSGGRVAQECSLPPTSCGIAVQNPGAASTFHIFLIGRQFMYEPG